MLDTLTAANAEGLHDAGAGRGPRHRRAARPAGVVNPLQGSATFRSLDATPLPELVGRAARARRPRARSSREISERRRPHDRPSSIACSSSATRPTTSPTRDEHRRPRRRDRARARPSSSTTCSSATTAGRCSTGRSSTTPTATSTPRPRCCAHPHAVPGLSDGGAHVGTICDASFPTTLLALLGPRPHRRRAASTPEWLVQRQCRATARSRRPARPRRARAGLQGRPQRHRLRPPRLHAPRLVFDLPAGGKRLLQPSTGYLHTFVSGVEVCTDGESTGATPGRLVRARAKPIRTRRLKR